MTHIHESHRRISWGYALPAAALAAGAVIVAANLPNSSAPVAPEDQSMPYFVDTDQMFYTDVHAMTLDSTYTVYKSELSELLNQPAATWLDERMDTQEVQKRTERITKAAAAAQRMPVLVSYNIPNRDLGQYSAGGTANAADFADWTESLSRGIGDRPAVIILEPDALPGVPSMSEAEGKERIAMLSAALSYYRKHNPKARVYLDAGHSGWLKPAEVVALLKQVDAGKGLVKYISLNVSNYRPHEEGVGYFEQVNEQYGGGLKAIIDDGINGAAQPSPAGVWCNPREARLGHPDDTYDPNTSVEGVWIRIPGESSGECDDGGNPAIVDGSDPAAGEFDPALLLTEMGHPTGRYNSN